jgi:hypothetical protein
MSAAMVARPTSPDGGHGDIHTFPVEWVHDTARMGAEFRLADGEAECAKVVREQLRRPAGPESISGSRY